MSGLAFHRKYGTDDQCRAALFASRWPDGPCCPRCSRINPYIVENGARFNCSNKHCKHTFSLTSGTLFDNTKMPLSIWFYLIDAIAAGRKKVSSVQLARDAGISQKSSYYASMKLRMLLAPLGDVKLSGVVEIDEATLVSRWSTSKVLAAETERMILGMKQRGGPLRLIQIFDRTIETLSELIELHIESAATVYTDGWRAYRRAVAGRTHRTVDHKSGQWTIGDVHLNNIEGTWSRLKKGIRYAHHNVYSGNLQMYCDEFAWKENTAALTDEYRFAELLHLASTRRVTYVRVATRHRAGDFELLAA